MRGREIGKMRGREIDTGKVEEEIKKEEGRDTGKEEEKREKQNHWAKVMCFGLWAFKKEKS